MLTEGQEDLEIAPIVTVSVGPSLKEGDVIGRLTVHSVAGKTPYGAVLWQCSCSCGEVELRPAHNLTRARANGRESMCRACLKKHLHEVGTGRLAVYRHARAVKRMLDFWERSGSLYSDSWTDAETHDLRVESELPDPVEMPTAPFTVDGDPETSWQAPDPDANDGMTLEEIGKVMGLTRERIRQIEHVALRKLRHNLEKLDAMAETKMTHDYLLNHGLIPLPERRRRVLPRRLGDVENVESIEKPTENKMKVDRWDRNNLGLPEGALLAGEAAKLLGWSSSTFHNRAAGWEPSGHVKSPVGTQWAYWSPGRIEEIRKKWQDRGAPTKRRPRRIIEVDPPPVDSSEAFPALLVVKAKVSGISMTIPVFVLQLARAEDGNHQVKVKFPGSVKDSIFDNTIIVWAKDLLTMDYSPYKTPWD